MNIDYQFRNHIGLQRARNEDACLAQFIEAEGDDRGGVFAVADGMGGHPGGEIASALAIDAVQEGLSKGPLLEPRVWLRGLFQAAAARIEERGLRDPKNRDMGTTLTVALVKDGVVWIGHIGDCRLYWIRDGAEQQITHDHTMAQDLVEAGLLHPSMADRHPSSHVLTRCLGACPDQSPDLLQTPLALEPGDRVLLASDGLVKAVKPSLLPGLLEGCGAEAGVNRLVDAALDGGAPDNVTVVLLVVSEPGPRPERVDCVTLSETANLHWSRG